MPSRKDDKLAAESVEGGTRRCNCQSDFRVPSLEPSRLLEAVPSGSLPCKLTCPATSLLLTGVTVLGVEAEALLSSAAAVAECPTQGMAEASECSSPKSIRICGVMSPPLLLAIRQPTSDVVLEVLLAEPSTLGGIVCNVGDGGVQTGPGVSVCNER